MTTTAGLQEKIITWDTGINCRGRIQVEDQYDPGVKYNFPCWVPGGMATRR